MAQRVQEAIAAHARDILRRAVAADFCLRDFASTEERVFLALLMQNGMMEAVASCMLPIFKGARVEGTRLVRK